MFGFCAWTRGFTSSSFRSTATTQAWSDESDLAFFYRAFGLSDFLLGDEETVTISLRHALPDGLSVGGVALSFLPYLENDTRDFHVQVLLDFWFLLLVASGFLNSLGRERGDVKVPHAFLYSAYSFHGLAAVRHVSGTEC